MATRRMIEFETTTDEGAEEVSEALTAAFEALPGTPGVGLANLAPHRRSSICCLYPAGRQARQPPVQPPSSPRDCPKSWTPTSTVGTPARWWWNLSAVTDSTGDGENAAPG
jgi:hypothetical protein